MNIWSNDGQNFFKINGRHQITDPRGTENMRQYKYQKYTYENIVCKHQKKQRKETSLNQAEGKKHFFCRESRINITAKFSSETIQARKDWSGIFKVLREKNTKLEFCILQIYPSKVKGKYNFYEIKIKERYHQEKCLQKKKGGVLLFFFKFFRETANYTVQYANQNNGHLKRTTS